MTAPDATVLHPIAAHPRVTFLQPLAEGRPNVTVGQYSYYDDPDAPEAFFERNVLHHYDFIGDHLHIGAFTAIATGVRIFMNGANHAMRGFSTFPFNIFGGDWAERFHPAVHDGESRGDTVIGPDVWIGHEALILPGTKIGAGAIIGARAVVSGTVPAYSVVVGNPATVIRHRYSADTVCTLLDIAWWDWPPERITRHLHAIRGADLSALKKAAE